MKNGGVMLPWVGAAMAMLLSPSEPRVTQPVSPDVLAATLVVTGRPERTTEARIGRWVSTLALVRPARGTSEAPSTMLVFVAVAPLGRTAGLWVIGSF